MKKMRKLLAALMVLNILFGGCAGWMQEAKAEEVVWEETDSVDSEEQMPEEKEEEEEEQPQEKEMQQISVAAATISKRLVKGDTFSLGAKTDGDGTLCYESSDSQVATVSKKGTVTMKGTGSTVITITASETEQYQEAAVQVKITLTRGVVDLGFSSSYKKSKYYKALMEVELIGNGAKDVVAVAKSQLGYHESNSSGSLGGTSSGSSNYTEYGRYCGANGCGWCSLFVNWVARAAGISTSVIPNANCSRTFCSFYKQSGQKYYSWSKIRQKSYAPKAGDMIFYSASKEGSTSHVGYVISSSYTSNEVKITTIEGNYSDKVVKREMILSRSGSGNANGMYILGVGHPKY